MSDEQAAALASPEQLRQLEESARALAAAFGAALPPIVGTVAAIAAYAAARAWVDSLAPTFGPNVLQLADRVAGRVRADVLTGAGLSSDGSPH